MENDNKVDLDRQTSEQVEDISTTKTAPFGTRVKRHYKRWWWVHVLALIIVVLVITLPLVYVGFPHIAQSDVNKSTLNISSLSITNPRADGFDLEVVDVIGSKVSYHPRLDAFNASLYLEDSDTPFTTLSIPTVNVHDGVTTTIKQSITLSDISAFTNYTTTTLLSKSFTIRVKGRTKLHEMKFPTTTVTYDKTVQMQGLDSLNGFNITSIQILLSPLADGSNMNGTVFIPNPTNDTIEMGDLTLLLSTPASESSTTTVPLGTSSIKNLILTPGGVTVPMTAITNETLVLGLLSKNPTYVSTGLLPVNIVGNSSVSNGEELPYFTHALAQNELSVKLNVKDALESIGLGSIFSSTSSSAVASATAMASGTSSGTSAATTTAL